MANRLAGATSPYLLQHKDNPVDWWPWSDEAFAEARRPSVGPDVRSGVSRSRRRCPAAGWGATIVVALSHAVRDAVFDC